MGVTSDDSDSWSKVKNKPVLLHALLNRGFFLILCSLVVPGGEKSVCRSKYGGGLPRDGHDAKGEMSDSFTSGMM